jgi:hypothetical protein
VKIKQALAKGEFIYKEMEALIKFQKYRKIKQRYEPDDEDILQEQLNRFK